MEFFLTSICRDLRNWHETSRRFSGTFTAGEGKIQELEGKLLVGQYYRIFGANELKDGTGSILNAGIYLYTGKSDEDMSDEVFTGIIDGLSIPREFVREAKNVLEEWQNGAGKKLKGPYSSESLSASGYSYQKASVEDISKADLQNAFPSFYNRWRKL